VEIDMNIQLAPTGLNPFDDPLDRILAEIALSVQLPPSLHDKAKSRYQAVRRQLEATTAFFDQIEHFYPQGSMAIDATISTRGTDDEYDLDIVSQLGGRFRGMAALEILTELEAALSDYPVQRVLRQTRCVTPVLRRQDAPRRHPVAARLRDARSRKSDHPRQGSAPLCRRSVCRHERLWLRAVVCEQDACVYRKPKPERSDDGFRQG
jgi:hypothetical protein